MNLNIYNRKDKTIETILTALIIIASITVFMMYLIKLKDLMQNGVGISIEQQKSEFIRFFNTVVAMIGVISCILVYSSNKKESLFFISLIYTIFTIDILISNIINYSSGNRVPYLGIYSSTIRLLIGIFVILKSSRIKKLIINNKGKFSIGVVFISIVFILLEYKNIIPAYFISKEFFIKYNQVLFLVYLVIAAILYVKSIKEKDIVNALVASGVFMFAIKSIYEVPAILGINISIKLISVSVTYIGFIIFIMGLFVELIENIRKNKILEGQMSLFFKIVNDNEYNNIVVCDESYNIKYLNKKASMVLDYEMIENNYYLNIEKVESNIKKNRYHNEVISIDKEGYEKIIDVSIQLFEKGNEKYRVIIFRDITKDRNIERELLEYENIKRQEQVKNEFFANVNHELKTPLNIIYSTMQLLNLNLQKDNFKQTYINYQNSIDINCKRMLRLIDNMIDITKFETNYKIPEFINYDIVNLIEGISLSIVNYAKLKDIDVIFDTDVEELEIKCDPDMIERVVLNLLSNAIKFTESGGKIFIDILTNEKWVTIKVKDNGIGIPLEIQDKIFNRFEQGDKTIRRKNEGSGIGLSLVKHIVEVSGGKIDLISDGKCGSEFIVMLPNKKLENEYKHSKIKNYSSDIQRINLEFSDIYELY